LKIDPLERIEAHPWIGLMALTALAALLRAIGSNGGLWLDEIITLVESARRPLAQILTVFPGNNQHPLYSVLAHASIASFGEAPWSLRLPALAFGAISPAALYLFARESTSRSEALLSALLLAVSYHAVWFSQNARGYSALAFFALAASWLLVRGLRRGRAGDFVMYAVACAFGAYTHLTMAFLVAGHAAACVFRLGLPVDHASASRWRLPLLGFGLAALFSLALYAPLLIDVQRFFLHRTPPPDVATPAWAARAFVAGLQVGLGTAVFAAAAALLSLLGLASYFRQSRFLTALFVLPGLITVAAVLALRQPIFPRFLFFLSGFAVLVVVRGAFEVGARISRSPKAHGSPVSMTLPGVVLVGLMIGASAASLPYDYRYPKQDFDGAMRFVDSHRVPGEPAITAGGAIYPFAEYYRRDWTGIRSAGPLRDVRARGQRVWVVYTLSAYIEAEAPDLWRTLREECTVAQTFRGTLAGGDVTVCTLAAASPNAAPASLR
jgi:mannosyltransferase